MAERTVDLRSDTTTRPTAGIGIGPVEVVLK